MRDEHKTFVTIQKLLTVNLSKCRVVLTQKIPLNAQDVTFIVALRSQCRKTCSFSKIKCGFLLSLPFVPRRLGMLNIKTTTRMNYVTVLEKLA